MPVSFTIPASPDIKVQSLSNFRGVDFANNPTQVSTSRSPDAQNIISDLAGKPVKRTGYKRVAHFPEPINGIFRLATEDFEKVLVHAGTHLYSWDFGAGYAFYEREYWVDSNGGLHSHVSNQNCFLLRGGMNNARSTAFQHNKKLYILDGLNYICYGEHEGGVYSVKNVEQIAHIPHCIAGRNPDGTSGTVIEDVNVLTKKRKYTFIGNADAKEYKLEPKGVKLDGDTLIVKVMNSEGEFIEKVKNTDYTVDLNKGIITFKTAPGASPAGGADNVEVVFSGETDYTADLINKCTIATQYGYGGSTDRVFVSGNPEAKNFHYWSDIDDPTYFPGLNYAYLGQDSSAILGYSRIGDALVVHKEDNEQDQTTFIVTGSYNTQEGYNFAISSSITGVGAISKYCFQRFGTEPLFLSRQGVCSITTQYLTTERYAQNRSYFVNPKLVSEPNLEEATAKEFNGYYYLSVNGNVYVADSRQKNYEKNAPQSDYQYEWYYLTNIDARVWWEYDGRLYFGTSNGKIMRFSLADEHTATDDSYSDDGEKIRAYWDTPVFSFSTLSRYKNLKGFWVILSPYIRSSVNVYYRYKGALRLIKQDTVDIFDFNNIDFTRFSFNTDEFPMIIATNAKAKKFMLIQFRIENNETGEGFGFYEMEATYSVAGKYKG